MVAGRLIEYRFEKTGEVQFKHLLRIALVLGTPGSRYYRLENIVHTTVISNKKVYIFKNMKLKS